MAQYEPIDWSAPLDVDSYKRLVPEGATMRGTQFVALADACNEAGLPLSRSYNSLKSYAGSEFLDVIVEAAEKLHPKKTLREALRVLGHSAYPALKETLVGKIIFAAAGRDLASMWHLAAKGYSVSASSGRAEVVEQGDGFVVMRLSEIYSFIDAWHPGIFEGVASMYDAQAEITMRRHSPMSADLHIAVRQRQGTSG